MLERAVINASARVALIVVLAIGVQALAKEDVGKGHDHRTNHSNGNVDYEQIGDSYTADLVMYLAGNQFMVMEELLLLTRS